MKLLAIFCVFSKIIFYFEVLSKNIVKSQKFAKKLSLFFKV